MSQENVEIAVGYFEAADLAAGVAALSEDVTFAFHGDARRLAGAETLRGKSAAVAWLADWFSRFDRDYEFEIDETLDMATASWSLRLIGDKAARAACRSLTKRRR